MGSKMSKSKRQKKSSKTVKVPGKKKGKKTEIEDAKSLSPLPEIQRHEVIRIKDNQKHTHQAKGFTKEDLKVREERIEDENKSLLKEFIKNNEFTSISKSGEKEYDIKHMKFVQTIDITNHLYLVREKDSDDCIIFFINDNEEEIFDKIPDIPFIPKPTNIFQCENDKRRVYLMESDDCLSLKAFSDQTQCTEDNVRIFIVQIIILIRELHKLGIKGLGINLDNIFVNEKGHIICSVLSIFSNSVVVPPEFMPPEGCIDNEVDDYWSVGIVTYFLFMKTFPFNSSSSYAIMDEIVDCSDVNESELSDDIRKFIKKLLCNDRTKRLDDESIVKEEWFDDIDWDSKEYKYAPLKFDKTMTLSSSRKCQIHEEVCTSNE